MSVLHLSDWHIDPQYEVSFDTMAMNILDTDSCKIYRKELKLDAISPSAAEENPIKNPMKFSKRPHLGVLSAVIRPWL